MFYAQKQYNSVCRVYFKVEKFYKICLQTLKFGSDYN